MIVDVNVLVYATYPKSPHHDRAHAWLHNALNGSTRVGLPWESLTGFQRVVTDARMFTSPLTPQKAWSDVTNWLAADNAWIPVPGPRHAEILGQLIVDGDLRGKRVPDAHLAAMAIENGVGVCSADTDFARFPGLHWINPLID
ncbi:MAG: type II toxin-antitoxin system VapC family toxin [Sciscionella sp.]|nr:type II toxin-antitoxin system VapC family toxin [Sciscionella sp.]